MVHALIVAVAVVVGLGSRWYFEEETSVERAAEYVVESELHLPPGCLRLPHACKHKVEKDTFKISK